MADPTFLSHDPGDPSGSPPVRPLIELSAETAERLRDPRLVFAIVAMAAGAVALLLGWYGVSGTYDPGVQLSYLVSGGLGGLFLAGVGAALVSSSNMRQATRKIDDLQRAVDELTAAMGELRAVVAEPPRVAPVRRPRKATTAS